MARLRNAPSTQSDNAETSTTRPALKEKTNTSRSQRAAYTFNEDIDELVKDARPRRGRAARPAPQPNAFVMTGGLGQAAHDERVNEQPAAITAPKHARGEGGAQGEAAKALPATSKPAQNAVHSAVTHHGSKRSHTAGVYETGLKKAGPQRRVNVPVQEDRVQTEKPPSSAQRAPKSGRQSSDSSSLSSPLSSGKLNSVKGKTSSLGQLDSALGLGSTPAIEPSILALKNFRRRPRQPSMLQMVQQRTTSARPSAANVPANGDSSVYDVDAIEDDEDDFAPEAEGTPLHMRKARVSTGNGPSHVSKDETIPNSRTLSNATRKRTSTEADLSSSAARASSAKRRKGEAAHLDASEATAHPRAAQRQPTQSEGPPIQRSIPDVEVINSSPSSSPLSDPLSPAHAEATAAGDVVLSTQKEQRSGRESLYANNGEIVTSEALSGTMADPLSSSPLPANTQSTDIMADPLTQASPPRKRKETKKETKPMTTANLQSLLPKRRRPLRTKSRKSEYDLESESNEDDPLDESHVEEASSKRSRGRTQQSSTTKKSASIPKTKSKSRHTKTTVARRRPTAARKPASAAKARASKTYTRAGNTTNSDKENEDVSAFEDVDEEGPSALPDTSISMLEAGQSGELQEARKKFAEIDEWDMEFESISIEEGRSSSQNWR